MKRLAAILLLLLLLFNLVGYRLWFYYAQQQSDTQLTASLDNEKYNDRDLVTIKIPLSLPYQLNRSDFERVNGEVNLNGQVYKYVKRKIEDGQLILLCLPDHNKMQIESAKDEFFKLANNLQTTAPVKKPVNSNNAASNILSDYDHTPHQWLLSASFIFLKNISVDKERGLITHPPHPLEQPPEIS